MAIQKKLTQADSTLQNCAMKKQHLTKEIKEQTTKMKTAEKEAATLKAQVEKKQNEVSKLETQLKETQEKLLASVASSSSSSSTSSSSSSSTSSSSVPSSVNGLRSSLNSSLTKLEDKLSTLHSEISALSARLSKLDFTYTNPAKNFDSKRVKGLVANLIEVKESNDIRAIEVTAGGRLYNIIVDTEETGKLLLEKGQLKKRVTIIPLNQITSKVIPAQIVAKAQTIAGGEKMARLALNLIGTNAEISAALNYIFGNTLVCTDNNIASKLTFHPEIRTRCVTLDGDSYDPAGTLEGGANTNQMSVLTQLQKLNEMKKEYSEKSVEKERLKKQLQELGSAEDHLNGLQRQVEVVTHEFTLLNNRFNSSVYSQLVEAVESLNQQLQQVVELEKTTAESKQELQEQLVEVERNIKEVEKGNSKNSTLELEKSLKVQQKKQTEKSKEHKMAVQQLEIVKLQLSELIAEEEATTKQLEKLKAHLAEGEKELEQLSLQIHEEKTNYDELNDTLVKEKNKIKEQDKYIYKLQKELTTLEKKAADAELTQRKLQHTVQKEQSELVELKKVVNRLLVSHTWMNQEKHLFNVPGSEYDFSTISFVDGNKQLAELTEEQDKLNKSINKKVLGMFEKAESEYNELMKKRSIIESDKNKIEQVIIELDIKKQQALESTWKKVSTDFGSIFSALLPGVHAKLEPPENGTVQDGLEMKVAFGKVWKESLSELSGGQRSLLALSLILALLLFKPAPMYILDEIDAALDLSHTQNIGQMLKKHFPFSQFIVVSLKEGMFNNANVLFRTKFVDGVSTVSRTTTAHKNNGASSSSSQNVNKENQNPNSNAQLRALK